MSLRKLTFLIVSVTTIGLLAVVLTGLTQQLRSHFEQQEKASVYLSIKQADNALAQQMTFLEKTSNDWANWNDTYDFIQSRDPQYNQTNLQASTFQDLGVDLMVLIDNQAQVVYGTIIGQDGQALPEIPSSILTHLVPGDALLAPADQTTSKNGLIVINNQPMALISHPILRTDGSGPSRGTFLLGKFIDGDVLSSINNLLYLTVDMLPIARAQSDPAYAAALSFKPAPNSPYLVSLSSSQVTGYEVLDDFFGQPALVMSVSQFPSIYNTGQLVNNSLILPIAMIILTFSAVLFLLIEFNVLRRVRQLSQDIVLVGASGDITKRLSFKRTDEISMLASGINEMLDALELAVSGQKKLEQDLRKRIDELGILYDVSQELLNQVEQGAAHQAICRLAVEKLGVDAAWIGEPSPDGACLAPVASYGIEQAALAEIPLYADAGKKLHPAAEAYNDLEMKLPSAEVPDQALPHRKMAAIPLTEGNSVLAVLVLMEGSLSYINKETLPMIRAFANLSSVTLQNAVLFQKVSDGRGRLHAVSSRLVEVQEQERRKIALELHDEIGQALTSLRLSLDLIETLPQEKVKNQISLAVENVNDLIARIRQMSLDLHPSMLDDLGIIPTLIWHLDRYNRQTGIQINLQHSDLIGQRFSPDIEITVYRIVQEALTNIARHAQVHSADVRLWSKDRVLGVLIEDQGAGFDPDKTLASYNSKGLLGMRERIGFLGGELQIFSTPGKGTTLIAEIPLEGFIDRRKRAR
jgi:signal transduction histidine kinase/sensor domain CHASE-containing protein